MQETPVVTLLSPKQWDQLQKIIAEDRGPNETLLKAAESYWGKIQSGEIVVEHA
jgi:hypothetical protein